MAAFAFVPNLPATFHRLSRTNSVSTRPPALSFPRHAPSTRRHAFMTAAPLAPPLPTPPLAPPAAALSIAQALGTKKASTPALRTLILAILAGAYIALGGLLALSVGGASPGLAASNPGIQKLLFGAVGLPFGLVTVLAAGGELFTGNTALVTSAVLAGRVSPSALFTNWSLAFLGNLAGALVVVALVSTSGVLAGGAAATAVKIASAKTGLTFGAALARGVVCNWMVCLAVWVASACSDYCGKFAAVLLPVSAFVACGFEHSVANMFFIPMGIALGADVGWKAFFVANLLPVTIGNILGGAILVAAAYHFAYGK